MAHRKAKAEAESQERPSTNEESVAEAGDQPPAKAITKKKRSIIGEHYYEEFSTEFWKEPGICFSGIRVYFGKSRIFFLKYFINYIEPDYQE